MTINNGVFCALGVDFADLGQQEAFATTPLFAQRKSLADAKIATQDSELFGSELTVKAKSLKDALATLEEAGLEITKKNVATWEKTSTGEIAIVTKGQLPRDATATGFLAWLKKRAKAGDTFFAVADKKKRLQVTGYLESYDDYTLLEEALLLLVAAAGASGAKARVGFWGDQNLLEEAVYLGVEADGARLEEVRYTEPQDITDEDATRFQQRFAIDFDAISKAHAKWLDGYEEKKTMALRGGNAGFVRADGSFLIEPKYPALGMFHEGLACFKNARWQWGYVDESGAEVIPAQFINAGDFKEGRARVKKEVSRVQLNEHSAQITNKVGFIDRTGAFVIEPTLDDVEELSDGRGLIKRNGKYGYVDESGQERIAATFDFATTFACGRALVCVGDRYAGGKWGFIDRNGDWVVEPRYQTASAMYLDHALVVEDRLWGVIDTDGRSTLSPKFAHAEWLKDGRIQVTSHASHGIGVVTADGRELVPPTFHRIAERGEAYEAMYPDLTRALFTREGSQVGSLRVAGNGIAAEGLIPVKLEADGLWGYVDMQGVTVIAPRFKLAFAFGQGRAIVCDDRGLAIIDREGREVARPALDPNVRDASAFGKSGLAWVERYKIALVALDGRVVIGPYLTAIYDMDGAAVWVKYAERS